MLSISTKLGIALGLPYTESDTIGTVKKACSEAMGIPYSSISLLWGGHVPSDTQTLGTLNTSQIEKLSLVVSAKERFKSGTTQTVKWINSAINWLKTPLDIDIPKGTTLKFFKWTLAYSSISISKIAGHSNKSNPDACGGVRFIIRAQLYAFYWILSLN